MTGLKEAQAVAESRPSQRMSGWVLACLLLSLVLWASAFPGIRAALRGYSPTDFASLRLLVAAGSFGLYALVRPVRRPSVRDLPMLALAGLTGMTLYQITLALGETRVSAGSASLISNTSPVMAAVLGALFLRERMRNSAWVGIAVSFCGAGLIGVGESHGGALRFEPGVLIVAGAALCSAAYLVVQKPLLARYGAIDFTIYSVWFGALFSLPWATHLVSSSARASPATTAIVVYLGLFPTAIAFAAWSYAYARIRFDHAMSSIYLIPVFAIAISYFWLGEIPRPMTLLGGLVTLIGVAVVASARA
jgi:drug/metabolite transporter (DMT)-like permease